MRDERKTKLADELRRFHRNACYPDATEAEIVSAIERFEGCLTKFPTEHYCKNCPVCDFPTCIGGECMHQCERQDKHEKYILDDEADVLGKLVRELRINADDCEDDSRWATPELAPLFRRAANEIERLHQQKSAAPASKG